MKKQFRNKNRLALAIGSVLAGLSGNLYAELDNTTRLNLDGPTNFFTMGGGTAVAAPGFDGQVLVGNNGLTLGTTQTPSGSHAGIPGCIDGVDGCDNKGENPTVDAPWVFFGNTGMSGSESDTDVLSASGNTATINLGGWIVAWNNLDSASGAATVPMGSGAWFDTTTDGVAQVTCDATCADGENYTLIYSATVPAGDPSNFGNTQYLLSLSGTITDTNIAPVIPPLAAISLTVLEASTLDVSAVITDAQGADTIDYATLTFSNNTCTDTPVHNDAGVITYTDIDNAANTCSFDISVADNEGKVSNSETVNVTISLGNPAPVAVDDGSAEAPIIAPVSTAIEIPVTVNDTDGDGIDVTSVTIVTDGTLGSAVADAVTGIVTYTPDNIFGNDTFTYTVNDNLASTSNTATVTIKVNSIPVADPASLIVTRGATNNFVVSTSDDDGTIDLSTLAILNSNCTATIVDDGIGRITYTDTGNAIASCTFDYTVNDNNGTVSNNATVSVSIINDLPVAVDDNAGQLDLANATSKNFNIAANDTDSDGTIDAGSITLASQPTNGTVELNNPAPGFVLYTPDPNFSGSLPFTDRFTYTINDNDAATSSNIASVVITIDDTSVAVLPPRDAILTLEASTVGNDVTIRPESGSWFSMELDPGRFTYTSVSGLNHLQLGTSQVAGVVPAAIGDIDEPWLFLGSLGVHSTRSDVLITSSPGDGTAKLDFSGWVVAWAGIQVVPMANGLDNGIASVVCTAGDDGIADCSFGDRYTLDYRATVPPGDPSNFGGVSYQIHMEGDILSELPILGCNDETTEYTVDTIAAGDCNGNVEGNVYTVDAGDIAQSAGKTTGTGLSEADVGKDPLLNSDSGEQCLGGCVDYVISNIPPGSTVNVVYKLSKPIAPGAAFRKLINGRWGNFDKGTGDALGSAPANGGFCQSQAGTYATRLNDNDECVLMSISDGGPNDADGLANGVIVDPGGLLVQGGANVPASSTESGSGCSLSGNSVNLMQRADWLLLFGFMVWLGLLMRRKQS